LFFGILTLLVALTISAVAIYYSVAGLVAIFAAAAIPIIIMGGALEIGKLVTAVWLHRYWDKAKWWMRLYLGTAVLVLMFITSMGIFGFLSKAHIEQTSAAKEQVAQLSRMDEEVGRQKDIILRAEQRIIKAEQDADKQDVGIQDKIDAEQSRIDNAYSRRQPSIDEQQGIITAQEQALQNRIAVYEDEITSLDTELQRLNKLVEQYRTELSNTSVASVEAQVQPYKDQIAQLDNDLVKLNEQASEYENIISKLQPELGAIETLKSQISELEERIANLQPDYSAVDTLKAQIATIEENIIVTTNKLQSKERAKIQEGQAVIGVTSDGLFGSNTTRAYNAWLEAQRARISELQAQETVLRTQAQTVVDKERERLGGLIKDLQAQSSTIRDNAQLNVNAERERLTGLIESIRGDQTTSIQNRKKDLLDTISRIRKDAQSALAGSREVIEEKINGVLKSDIPANRQARTVAQSTISKLQNTEDSVIEKARAEIAKIRKLAEDEILNAQAVIERLRAKIQVGENADLDAIVDAQNNRIKAANDEIDSITERKFALQAEARKLEAEVGPVKYLAEFIYEDADRDTLEEAVRWVILIIIFVFDPLAVALLIAAQYTFEWRREGNKPYTPPTPPAPKKKKPEPKKPEPKPEPVVSKWEEAEIEETPVVDEPTQSYSDMKEESIKEVLQPKVVDKDNYNPYTDSRSDAELTDDELKLRHDIWPPGYTGKLNPTKPFKED